MLIELQEYADDWNGFLEKGPQSAEVPGLRPAPILCYGLIEELGEALSRVHLEGSAWDRFSWGRAEALGEP